jgi:hypothetical protein
MLAQAQGHSHSDRKQGDKPQGQAHFSDLPPLSPALPENGLNAAYRIAAFGFGFG